MQRDRLRVGNRFINVRAERRRSGRDALSNMYHELIVKAEGGDNSAARALVRDLRAAFSSQVRRPVRPELRRYLAKQLSRLLNDDPSAFNMRRVAHRPEERGRDQRELKMAARYLAHRGKKTHVSAVKAVARIFRKGDKAVEAAITRWTEITSDGSRTLVFVPRPKKLRT